MGLALKMLRSIILLTMAEKLQGLLVLGDEEWMDSTNLLQWAPARYDIMIW